MARAMGKNRLVSTLVRVLREMVGRGLGMSG
jgi:pentatricopeptide repeat protein